jgi:hypothetical protein
MLNLARVRHRGDGGRGGCGRDRLSLPAVGRALVLAVMDMPTALMTAAMMTSASGMTTPMMDGRTMVMNARANGSSARPDSGCRGENACNEQKYDNQEASHGIESSLWPCGWRSPSLAQEQMPSGLGDRSRTETKTHPSVRRRELCNSLLEVGRRWPVVAAAGTLAPVATDAQATCFSIDPFRLRVRRTWSR